MRILLGGTIAVALAFSQSPQPGQSPGSGAAPVIGRVTTGTGSDTRPVRRAKVTVTGAGLTAPLVIDTDTGGVFRTARLPTGAHKVTVQKPGFVTLETTWPADAAPNASLALTRGGAIEGVVTDAAGDPIWNVVVNALQAQADAAAPKVIVQTRTDDLGRYRLHSLAAGDYSVEAATDRVFLQNVFLMQGEKRPEINKAYYPAGATMDAGKPVRVTAGRDTTGIDITFSPAAPVKDPAAPPAAPRPDATGTGRIAGTVTDAVSGKPIKAAELLLLPAPGQGQRLTNWTRTDSLGRFDYKSLEAQRYVLSFRAPRFVNLDYGQKRPGETGTQIQLREGEDFRADMKLPRASALEGTLLDEFGEPAPNVLVQVAQRQYAAGRQRLMPVGGRLTAPSDDRGHYRISNLPPADYFVAALSGVYTEANEVGGFAPTYHPGTADSGGAAPVTVAFGADTLGITFALVPAKTFSVSGTMVDADGKPVSGRGTLTLATPDRLKRADFNLARTATAPDGTFVLRNVPQGMYTMQGFAPPPAGYQGPGNLGAMAFGWAPLTVGDVDLDGVVLKTTPGTTLRGQIVFDDTRVPLPKPDQVRVSAIPVEFDSAPIGGGPSPSETREDWTFEGTRQSGLRRILAGVASPSWTVKKITLNDIDVTDTPVDFRSKDVDGVQVVFTSKVSRVIGAVSDDKGPVADYVVIIFASDPTKWMDRSRFITMARPTQQGGFTANGLPPEDYLAVALPAVAGTEYMDPEFLQQLRPLATRFVLQEGESKTLALTLKKKP